MASHMVSYQGRSGMDNACWTISSAFDLLSFAAAFKTSPLKRASSPEK
jgi:hypothetical protein